MIERDKSDFAEALAEFLGFFGKRTTDFDVGAWYGALKRFELNAIRRAFKNHAEQTADYRAPKPAMIAGMLRETAEKTARPTPAEYMQARPEIEAIIERDGLRRRKDESGPEYRNRMRAYMRGKLGMGVAKIGLPAGLMDDEPVYREPGEDDDYGEAINGQT